MPITFFPADVCYFEGYFTWLSTAVDSTKVNPVIIRKPDRDERHYYLYFCIFIPVWFSENKRIQQLLYSSNSVLLVFPLPFWIYDGRSQNDREIQRKSSAAAEDEALWSPSVLLAGTCYSILNCSAVGWFCSWALLKIWDMLWRFSVG